ncbi:hypothetical protein [Kribbella deserti]|uniref:Holliday junction nuclease RuvC n=1 Tax=Kribbella deserti TaxID=1926257 RepID=A0ABV6QNC1_9ACTN
MIVVGLDTSLTSTGLLVLEVGPDRPPAAGATRIESKAPATGRNPDTGKKLAPNLKQRLDRLTAIEQRITSALFNLYIDLAVIESPSFGSVGSASRDLAGLWWRVVGKLDHMGIPVAEVSPAGRTKYALGSGKAAPKDRVLAAVIKRYPDFDITGNDIADALILAAMGARHLGHPIDDLPQANLAAMNGAHWPAPSNPAA